MTPDITSTPPVSYQIPTASQGRLGGISFGGAAKIPLTYKDQNGVAHPLKGGKAGFKLAGGAIYIDSDLDTDADGSPRATTIDPYGQLQTALTYPGITGQAKNVDAEKVPYFVLPGGFYAQFGIKKGDVGALIYKDKVVYALFADVGPKDKIGEASVKAVESLGHNPWNGNHTKIISGIGKDVVTIVFPGSANQGINPNNVVSLTEAKAKSLFKTLGGKTD